MKRKIVFSVAQFKELVAEPRLAVAFVKVLDGDMSLTTEQAIITARSLLRQFDMFEAGQRIQFDAFEVAKSEDLSLSETTQVVDGSAVEVKPPIVNPIPDDLSKAERKLVSDAIEKGTPLQEIADLILARREPVAH